MTPPVSPPLWHRAGIALPSGQLGPDWSDHCQMPTPLLMDDGGLRMYFTARNADNRSHIFYADLDATPPWRIREVCKEPVLAPGPLGAFDAAGVMPTSVIWRDGEIWLYYSGWTERRDVPYHNAIGLAISRDGGHSFTRATSGPIVSTGPNEPYFCGSADVHQIGDQWVMWYSSTTEWREIAGKLEPRYHLKRATSSDGIIWDHGRDVAIDYASEDEGGVVRATVLHSGKEYWMWFCFRGIADYRGTGAQGYRLGVAHSADAVTWQRLPDAKVLDREPDTGDFDTYMQCYPVLFTNNTTPYLFYNGNGFGQTGIGYAMVKP